MTDIGTTTDDLLGRARAGDAAALGALFAHYRDRLRNMVRLRIDQRVARRLDPSDVLQEAFLDVARRFRSTPPRRRCRSTSGCGR
jgi:RNA polymerase sigma-70 factor, ECF subfamily